MTGGNSNRLSVIGVPSPSCGSLRSPGSGFGGGGFVADGFTAAVLACEGLLGMTLTMGFPSPAAVTRRTRRREADSLDNVVSDLGFHLISVSRFRLTCDVF